MYFLQHAHQCAAGGDWDACEANLLAAIQFGRNVTFHLQKELDGVPWFEPWYAPEQSSMSADSLMRFLDRSRVEIVHRRPPDMLTAVRERWEQTLGFGWNVAVPDPP